MVLCSFRKIVSLTFFITCRASSFIVMVWISLVTAPNSNDWTIPLKGQLGCFPRYSLKWGKINFKRTKLQLWCLTRFLKLKHVAKTICVLKIIYFYSTNLYLWIIFIVIFVISPPFLWFPHGWLPKNVTTSINQTSMLWSQNTGIHPPPPIASDKAGSIHLEQVKVPFRSTVVGERYSQTILAICKGGRSANKYRKSQICK